MAVTKVDLASQAQGVLPATSLPNPSASTLGGVESLAVVTSKWLNTISTSGIPAATQPAFTDISGSLQTAQMLALTGDTFGTSGSTATLNRGLNGVALSGLATGILKNTTGTGVPVIAAAGTDYLTPSGSSAALSVASSSVFGVVKVDGTTIVATAGVISAAGATPNFSDNEVPSGTPNGVLVTFGLVHTPVSTSLSLYLNGVLQQAGAGNDYTIATATITMLAAPATGDKLLANYRY
jgi:hypothetical protein